MVKTELLAETATMSLYTAKDAWIKETLSYVFFYVHVNKVKIKSVRQKHIWKGPPNIHLEHVS